MKSIISAIALLLFMCSITLADNFPKVKSYDLDIEFIPSEAYMTGVATIKFNQTESDFTFYLHGELRVDSIKCQNGTAEFEQEKVLYGADYSYVGTEVTVTTGKCNQYDVYYRGYMNPSKARSPSNYMRIDDSGVFLRSFGYSVWFPVLLKQGMNEYNVDFDNVVIKTPKEFSTVFVGSHVKDTINDSKRYSYWTSKNTNIFSAQCTVQKFIKKNLGAVNVYSWNDEQSTKNSDSIISFSRLMVDSFASRYNSRAKLDQLHIVEMPKYGNISSGNMTGVSFDLWQNFSEENFTRRVLAHELVHSYVQLEMDIEDSLYTFFIEGFPSFFHLPVLEEYIGKEYYDSYLKRLEKKYITYKTSGKDRRGSTLPAEKPLDRIKFDEIGTYKDYFVLGDRAILFLHHLRKSMGDEMFASFSKELFHNDRISSSIFKTLVLKYLPDYKNDLLIWLSTNEFPNRFKL